MRVVGSLSSRVLSMKAGRPSRRIQTAWMVQKRNIIAGFERALLNRRSLPSLRIRAKRKEERRTAHNVIIEVLIICREDGLDPDLKLFRASHARVAVVAAPLKSKNFSVLKMMAGMESDH